MRFRVLGLGFRGLWVWVLGFRGLGFGVWGLGFRYVGWRFGDSVMHGCFSGGKLRYGAVPASVLGGNYQASARFLGG